MKTRKIITGMLSVLLVGIALYALAKIQYEHGNFGIDPIDEVYFKYAVIQSLLFSSLGLLVTKDWIDFFLIGSIKVRPGLLTGGFALFILGAIPAFLWIIHLGLAGRIYVTILASTYANHAMSLMAGVLIGRSFVHKNENRDLKQGA